MVRDIADIIDEVLTSGSGKWKYVASNRTCPAWPGEDFASLDGDEEVYILQLNHSNWPVLLERIGIRSPTLTNATSIRFAWKEVSMLTPAQRELRDLAEKMVFHGCSH